MSLNVKRSLITCLHKTTADHLITYRASRLAGYCGRHMQRTRIPKLAVSYGLRTGRRMTEMRT